MIGRQVERCTECGCPFSSAIEKALHGAICAAADSKYSVEDIVNKRGIVTPLFRKMEVVVVVKNGGVHIFTLKGVDCPSLVVTALEGEIEAVA
jgi:hypothetical protein